MDKSGMMKKGHVASYINDTSIMNQVVGEVTFYNVTEKEIEDYFEKNLEDDWEDAPFSSHGFGKLHKLVNFENCLFTYDEMIKICQLVVQMLTINRYNKVVGFPEETPRRGVRLTNCKIDYGTENLKEQKKKQQKIENFIRLTGFEFSIVQ